MYWTEMEYSSQMAEKTILLALVSGLPSFDPASCSAADTVRHLSPYTGSIFQRQMHSENRDLNAKSRFPTLFSIGKRFQTRIPISTVSAALELPRV